MLACHPDAIRACRQCLHPARAAAPPLPPACRAVHKASRSARTDAAPAPAPGRPSRQPRGPPSLIDAMHPFTAATHTLHFARAPAATHASLRTIDCWLAACFAQDGVSTSDSEDLLSDEHGPSPMQVWCALSLSHRLACTYITAPCNLPHSPHVTFCPHYCNKPRVRACIRPTVALLPAHGHTPSLQHGPSLSAGSTPRYEASIKVTHAPHRPHIHPPTNQPTNQRG